MLRVAFVIAVILAPVITLAELPTTQAVTTQPGSDFRQLLEKLPTGLTGDASIKSFAVVAELKVPQFPVLVYAAQRSPDDQMLYLAYANDNVPFLYVANGESILFDSVSGVVRRLPKVIGEAKFSLGYNPENGKEKFSLEFGWRNAKDAPPGVRALIDLRSFVQMADQHVYIGRDGNLDVMTGSTPRGMAITSWLDNTKPVPLTRLTMSSADKPLLVIHHFSVNESVPGSPFAVPSEEELRKVLPVNALDGTLLDSAKMMLAFVRSVGCRMAITDPTMRPGVEKYLGKVDWVERQKKDVELAAPLIKLLGDRIPTTQPSPK